ncbi:MAG: RNA-binding S4 domain-containing protein [Parasporobacterium sp.]|nr:RNA-binding S4 domain-containing protein [Parasporobacterium sp.]
MNEFYLRDEFIKLGQLLKACGIADSGVTAKIMIEEGLCKVNGETEVRRGRKLYEGDVVEVEGETVKICA